MDPGCEQCRSPDIRILLHGPERSHDPLHRRYAVLTIDPAHLVWAADPPSSHWTVAHASEIAYVYGQTALTSPIPAVRLLSEAMVDYWISFAVSLTPNDGKGLSSTYYGHLSDFLTTPLTSS